MVIFSLKNFRKIQFFSHHAFFDYNSKKRDVFALILGTLKCPQNSFILLFFYLVLASRIACSNGSLQLESDLAEISSVVSATAL